MSEVATNIEPVGDIVSWVDTKLMSRDHAVPRRVSNCFGRRTMVSMGSFVDGCSKGLGLIGSAAIGSPEGELQKMRRAESEQCAVDDFWGLDANQGAQAKATAEMEEEDRRSREVHARIEKEQMFAIWEREHLRDEGMRRNMARNFEEVAQRVYLEVRRCLPITTNIPP